MKNLRLLKPIRVWSSLNPNPQFLSGQHFSCLGTCYNYTEYKHPDKTEKVGKDTSVSHLELFLKELLIVHAAFLHFTLSFFLSVHHCRINADGKGWPAAKTKGPWKSGGSGLDVPVALKTAGHESVDWLLWESVCFLLKTTDGNRGSFPVIQCFSDKTEEPQLSLCQDSLRQSVQLKFILFIEFVSSQPCLSDIKKKLQVALLYSYLS